MFDMRQAFAEFYLPPDGSLISFQNQVHADSLAEAMRYHREGLDAGFSVKDLILRQVDDYFSGGTSEEEEDKALGLLLSTWRAGDLHYLVNRLTWDGLDDDLDEPDLSRIARHFQQLTDHRDYSVAFLMRWFYLIQADNLQLRSTADLGNYIAARSTQVKTEFSNRCWSQRDRILAETQQRALRGQATFVREFRMILDAQPPAPTPNIVRLSWEVFYTERICALLEQGEFRLLLDTLPELFLVQLPNNPPARSNALFDMLRRWDRLFGAMEVLINSIGSPQQRSNMRQFMDTKRVMMDNFPGPGAAPGAIAAAIAAIISALNGIGSGFQALINTVHGIAGTIETINAPRLLDTASDDEAVAAINRLSSTGPSSSVALIPTGYKLLLIRRMLSGAAEDEEEQATLTVLRDTKQVSAAEFMQLISGVTWEILDSNFNGSEYDQLEELFRF